MENNKINQDLKDIESGLGFSEPTILEDLGDKLGRIENELLLLNEKIDSGLFRSTESLLFFILLTLIYIAIKLH